ncbi:MAG: haloacid dehalogenase [Methylomonas sp.]|nr:MAG: haloacid dehalogenase [Methylomonas sp.]
MRFRAIIFDMDGLVLDSESGYFAAWRQAAIEMGLQLDLAFCHGLSGTQGSEISQRLLAHYGPDFQLERFYELSKSIWLRQVQQQGIPVKSGFYQLISLVNRLNLPYCLATNSRRVDALQCLNWAGLEGVFERMICREDVSEPKPAADIFLKAAELLNTAPEQCLVLEDSPVGVAAASAAACHCLFVPSVLPADSTASKQAQAVMADLSVVADFISAAFDHPL